MRPINTTQGLLDHIQELKDMGIATIQADNTFHEEDIKMTGCTYDIENVPEPIFSNVAIHLRCSIVNRGNFKQYFVVSHLENEMTVTITVKRI